MKRSLLVVALSAASAGAFAQISFTDNYSENFNAWPSEDDPSFNGVSVPWVNNSTKLGWYQAVSVFGNWFDNTRLNVNTYGAGQRLTSIGARFDSERAIGASDVNDNDPSPDVQIVWGLQLQNNSGSVIDALNVAFTVEHWRRSYIGGGPNEVPEVNVSFAQYRVGGVDFNTYDGFINAQQLDLISQAPLFDNDPNDGLQDGNLGSNQTAVSSSLTGLNWQPGQSLWLRWLDPNNVGRDATLAIDNLAISAAPVPEPATMIGLGSGLFLLIRRRRSAK